MSTVTSPLPRRVTARAASPRIRTCTLKICRLSKSRRLPPSLKCMRPAVFLFTNFSRHFTVTAHTCRRPRQRSGPLLWLPEVLSRGARAPTSATRTNSLLRSSQSTTAGPGSGFFLPSKNRQSPLPPASHSHSLGYGPPLSPPSSAAGVFPTHPTASSVASTKSHTSRRSFPTTNAHFRLSPTTVLEYKFTQNRAGNFSLPKRRRR